MSSNSQNPNQRKYLKSFISGGCAGIVAKSVIAPFDRVKILFVVISILFNAFSNRFGYRQAQESLHTMLQLTKQPPSTRLRE